MNTCPQNNFDPNLRVKSNTPLIIALVALIAAAVVAVGALMWIFLGGKIREKDNFPPVLTVTFCPEQVDSVNPTVVIQGTLRDDASACVLAINGETVCVADRPGITESWSKSFTLAAGETAEYTLSARDESNNVTSETRTVFCRVLQTAAEPVAAAPEPTGPLREGCEFVKKKSKGLNIREYAGTDYAIVQTIPANDYTSRMTFTGYYESDWEGYVWYEVLTPNGKYGYVRSDLVKRVS